MSAPERAAPSNLVSLRARIRNVAQDRRQQPRRIQRAIASAVVGQMLPDGVVKGGTAIKIRVGEAGSRYTPDFDASRPPNVSVDHYIEQLRDRFERGWSGFTGTVRVLEPRQVQDVPLDHLMQPCEIRLAYRSRHWLTVEFELGHDEVGSTTERELRIADDIRDMFAAIGLLEPAPIALMLVEHQVAQKLHACSFVNPRTNRNDRAHDLVDLQILEQEEAIDYEQLSRDRLAPLRRPTRARVAAHRRRIRRLGHDLSGSRRRTRRPANGRRSCCLGERPDRTRRVGAVPSPKERCAVALKPVHRPARRPWRPRLPTATSRRRHPAPFSRRRRLRPRAASRRRGDGWSTRPAPPRRACGRSSGPSHSSRARSRSGACSRAPR